MKYVVLLGLVSFSLQSHAQIGGWTSAPGSNRVSSHNMLARSYTVNFSNKKKSVLLYIHLMGAYMNQAHQRGYVVENHMAEIAGRAWIDWVALKDQAVTTGQPKKTVEFRTYYSGPGDAVGPLGAMAASGGSGDGDTPWLDLLGELGESARDAVRNDGEFEFDGFDIGPNPDLYDPDVFRASADLSLEGEFGPFDLEITSEWDVYQRDMGAGEYEARFSADLGVGLTYGDGLFEIEVNVIEVQFEDTPWGMDSDASIGASISFETSLL